MVQLGTRADQVRFYVVERLGASAILGCDFCDKHVDSIRPRQRSIILDDGTTVPIVSKTTTRKQDAKKEIPIPEEQQYTPRKGRVNQKIKVEKEVTLQPGEQTWVQVTTKRHGLILVESINRLTGAHLCATGTGVARVEPDKPFRILISNFGNHPYQVRKGQHVANAASHPTAMLETNMSHAEMLGIDEEVKAPKVNPNKNTAYKKRELDVRNTDVINKHLSDLRESHMDEDEKPVRAEDVPLGVPQRYHKRIREMLKHHEHMWMGKLGNINITEHQIDLIEGARPSKAAPYRAGPKTRQLEEFEVKKQLEADVIEPAQSEWAAPVLFAPKKDGKLRFCIDYRKLNGMTVRDSYPLPRMDECIDSLGDAQIFTTLDAYSGYWQMPIRPQDRPKTAFVCHAGTYQYKRMPFGLTNAPASFQRALDLILTRHKWKTCLIYLDDVVVYSNSIEEHITHVNEILTCLSEAGVTLKIKKCSFFTKEIEYLGHTIKPGKLEIDRANTESLRQAVPPTNKSELRSFLGLCNVYRRFIPGITNIAQPLNNLLKKDQPDSFECNEDQLTSFRKLIDAILSPEILALPKAGLPYSLDTDASKYQVGCALFQEHPDGTRRPIGFWSRSLNNAEKNYSASERECLAVVWALKILRPYLMYEKFTVYTDHAALRWLLTICEPSGRLMRWRLRLAEFDFNVQYKRGKLNQQADALSRLRTMAETIDDDSEEIPTFLITDSQQLTNEEESTQHEEEEDILSLEDTKWDELFMILPEPTQSDPTFQPILEEELLSTQFSDPFCTEIRRRLNGGEVLPFTFNEEGILMRTGESNPQIVIPHVLKGKVLHIHHYARLAGHPGGKKLYHAIRRHMYWPSLALDCYGTVRRCASCARNRIKLRKNTTELQLFPAQAPLESVCIDVLGELIKTSRGHEYLLVITDRFTKLTKTVPLKGISAAEVAKAFVTHWVFNFGPPIDLLADNGKCFTAKFFQDVCQILNIHNSFTTTYHPQANGQVERFNRTIKTAIRAYLADHPPDWDLYTDALTYAYNCQPHTSTAIAPFELVLSRPPPSLALRTQPIIGRNPTKQKRNGWTGSKKPSTERKRI